MKVIKVLEKRYCPVCGTGEKSYLISKWGLEFFKCSICQNEEEIYRVKPNPKRIIEVLTDERITFNTEKSIKKWY